MSNPTTTALQAASRNRRDMRQSVPAQSRTEQPSFGNSAADPLPGTCVREGGIEPPRRSYGFTGRWAHHLPNSRMGCQPGIEPGRS